MTARDSATASGILTFSERGDVARELLAAGRQLAEQSGGGSRLIALEVAPEATRAAEAIERGADEVLHIRPSWPGLPPPLDVEALVAALRHGIELARPSVVLVGSTRTGVEVASRLAQQLGVGCATDCLALRIDDAGDLEIERRVYGGRFVARQVIRTVPRIATVPAKRFEPPARDPARRGTVREADLCLPAPRMTTVAVTPPGEARSHVDISKAPVIVALGRGVKQREDIPMIERLAELLGGEVAGTRPVTSELHWLPADRRVGLSGQTVKPALYIACGISGQIEHVIGMRAARTVVAINTDARAPMHAEADYCVVRDLYEIVPALIEAVSAEQRGHLKDERL